MKRSSQATITKTNEDRTRQDQNSEASVTLDSIRNLLNPNLIRLNCLPSHKKITLKTLDPHLLLTCSRFDILPKYVYARYRELGIDSQWGLELYTAHLQAFNGCYEADGSGKSGIEAFVRSFNNTIDSVKNGGFDSKQSLVPIGTNGVAIDGSHRIAACLIHQKSVNVAEFGMIANSYDYVFFSYKGLASEYCDAIALEYCRLNPRAHIVSVFPSAVGKEREIRNILERHGEIFYARQVLLSRLGSVNLVRQMYDGEHWVGSFANRFEGAQNKAAECFRTDGPVRVYVYTSDDFEKVKAAKQQIRDLFGISNHSVHVNDTHEETVRLGRLLLNDNSVHFLNNAQLITFPRFQACLDNYKKVLREKGVDSECLCIDGSAVMAAYGIREARDLDYLHFGYDNLTFDYPHELIGSHNSEIAHHVTTRDDIIFNPRNHFYYDGVKFASLNVIRALKQKRGEPKDFDDVALIDRFITTQPTPPHVHRSAVLVHGAGQAAGAGRQPKIVGLVPARNEKHIIAQCLRALSLFTDAIVYLDDASTDETPDIVASLASQCCIERIIRKQEWHRDEPGDRNTMLQAGREIGGTHFIVIDADEMLSSNLLVSSRLRNAILQLKIGDRIALNWIQLWRSLDKYRFDQTVWTWNYKDIIFCDDGRCSYSSEFIHTPRVPSNLPGSSYTVQGYEFGLLHFQFVNWRNLLVKQAWYRCLERIREPDKPVAAINERYAASKDESRLGLKPVPKAWLEGYPFFERTVYNYPDEWREKQILDWFYEYGYEYFSNLDIWDIKWDERLNTQKTTEFEKQIVEPVSGQECNNSQTTSRVRREYLVSAIVSTYKSERFIRGCLEDLLRQTLYQRGELEIVVIDSASPENEAVIVREFQKSSPHIRYFRTTTRETVYASWNLGIAMAQGKYITNANTDDRHRYDAFELMAKTLDVLPDIDLVYADVLVTLNPNETFETTKTTKSYNWRSWDRNALLEDGCFIGPQPMWRRSLHELYGFFNPSYVTSGDYEFWLRISQTSHFQHIDQPLGLYLARPDSIEHSNEALKHRENSAIRKLYRDAADRGQILGMLPGKQWPLNILQVVHQAHHYARRGEVTRAIHLLLDQGIRIASDSAVLYIALAEILISEERYQDALEVLPEMPLDTDPVVKLELEAICRCALGDESAARQAALQGAGRPRVLVVLGTLAARQGDLAEAEHLFRQAIAADPSCGNGWLSLGMLLWGQGQQTEAWQAVKRTVMVDPMSQKAVQILCDMADRLNQELDALEILESALGRYPDCRHLALQKAALTARKGLHDDALAACEDFLAWFGADDQVLELACALRKRIGVYNCLAEGNQQSISLCMIVKDEEACLARCLASAKPVVHELVVVDTGSTDRTVTIATAFGARVSHFTWNDSFADARNYGLEQAQGNWILILDADEVISAQDRGTIAATVCSAVKGIRAFSVQTRNYTTMIHAQGWTANDASYPEEERAEGWQPSWKVRLFPNDHLFRFNGEVHEMVEATLREAGVPIEQAPFVIHHYGKLEQDPIRQLDKKLRYFETGMRKLAQDPDDLAAICELAVQAGELGRFEEGTWLWDRVLQRHPYYVEALFNNGFCLMGLQRYAEALELSRRVLEQEPAHKEAALNYGTCELYVGDPRRALQVVESIAARYSDYPLLKALQAALYGVCGQSYLGRQLVAQLRQQGYGVAGYLQARCDTLRSLGRDVYADGVAWLLAKAG